MADLIFPDKTSRKSQPWRLEFKQLVSSLAELAQLLDLDLAQLAACARVDRDFPLRISRSFVARMKPGDLKDPLLLQALPLAREEAVVDRFIKDPLHEQSYRPMPGVIHKYSNRALLVMSGLCAIHCRYCFRRHFPYGQDQFSLSQLPHLVSYLNARPRVNELILSGGDPLSVPLSMLTQVTDVVSSLEQIKRFRLHTRLPIVIPDCIDDAFIAWTVSLGKPLIVVVHVNHPQEIDHAVMAALLKLRTHGIRVLNQTVLLRGINDQSRVLIDLSERLFDLGVIPYYIHQLDPVQGAAHFAVDLDRAQALLFDMSCALPGYLVPKLVTDRPGDPFKMIHCARSS